MTSKPNMITLELFFGQSETASIEALLSGQKFVLALSAPYDGAEDVKTQQCLMVHVRITELHYPNLGNEESSFLADVGFLLKIQAGSCCHGEERALNTYLNVAVDPDRDVRISL